MKKLYLFALLLGIVATVTAQTFQATIKPGGVVNSVMLAIKPSADVIQRKLSSLTFPIAIPSTILPKPTVSIKTNFNTSISYEIQVSPNPEAIAGKIGTYYIYNFIGDGAQASGNEKDYLAASDINMLEVELTGVPDVQVSNTLLVNLPDGGATGQSNFYIANQGTDVTNYAAMFYGTGAVNGPGGLSGTSFVGITAVTPVNFLSFFAVKNGDDAKLNWTVENDMDNAYFEVQRSLNGISYNTIAKVNAFRNGNSSNTYELADPRLSNLGSKSIFYRIKQVDVNGTITYSQIRNLNLTLSMDAINLFPNPARTTTKLVLDVQNAGKATVLIRDATGKQVQMISLQLNKGLNQRDINVAMLPAGEYNVTVIGTDLNQTIKLSKIN